MKTNVRKRNKCGWASYHIEDLDIRILGLYSIMPTACSSS